MLFEFVVFGWLLLFICSANSVVTSCLFSCYELLHLWLDCCFRYLLCLLRLRLGILIWWFGFAFIMFEL